MMRAREALAHRALRAVMDAYAAPFSPDINRRYEDAVNERCPECGATILYCRCYDTAVALEVGDNSNGTEDQRQPA